MCSSIEKINSSIEKIESNIYDYDLNAVFTNLNNLIFEISDYVNLKKLTDEDNFGFNTVLKTINNSIHNKDYILLSDVLKFQLKNYLEKI